MVGRGSYQGMLRPESRPLGLGLVAGTVAPPPIRVTMGPGAGEGGKALTSTGLTLLQVLVIARTLGRGHQEVICVLGWGRGEVGKEEDSRLGQQLRSHLLRCGMAQGTDPGTPWTMPQLSQGLLADHRPPFPPCKERLNSVHLHPLSWLLGVNVTAHILPFIL